MYRFTEKAYKEIKAERYYVIVFEGDRRVSTFGGCHMLDAMKEIMKLQNMNRTILLVSEEHVKARQEDRTCTRWEKESYADLFELARKDGRGW